MNLVVDFGFTFGELLSRSESMEVLGVLEVSRSDVMSRFGVRVLSKCATMVWMALHSLIRSGHAFGRCRRYRARTRRTSYTCSFRGAVHCAQVGSMEPPGCWGDAGVPSVRHYKLLGEMWPLSTGGQVLIFGHLGPPRPRKMAFLACFVMFRHGSASRL